MTAAFALRRVKARRIKPPKLPRWLWWSISWTVICLTGTAVVATAFAGDPTPRNALSLVNGVCLTAGWWRLAREGLRRWKRTLDSTALPTEPRPDGLSVALWLAAFATLAASFLA